MELIKGDTRSLDCSTCVNRILEIRSSVGTLGSADLGDCLPMLRV